MMPLLSACSTGPSQSDSGSKGHAHADWFMTLQEGRRRAWHWREQRTPEQTFSFWTTLFQL